MLRDLPSLLNLHLHLSICDLLSAISYFSENSRDMCNNSSRDRLRKSFVRGHIHELFIVSKALTRIVSRSLGFWHKQAREYNPVQSTFYDVNYIFDKKTTEDDSGSEGKFWRRNRQHARKMRRGSNFHQSICELQTNAVDSKLSFSLKYDLIFFYSKSLE